MNNFFKIPFYSIILATFSFSSCMPIHKSDEESKVVTTNEKELAEKRTATNLDFLKELNGKYPIKVKLFDNSAFTERLKKLLGYSRYTFLTETWAVETPIQFTLNNFVVSGCKAHDCSSTYFIIVFDFSKNVMYAGIRENDEVTTYSEDGSNSTYVKFWSNQS